MSHSLHMAWDSTIMASLRNLKKNNDNGRLQTELQIRRVTIIMF